MKWLRVYRQTIVILGMLLVLCYEQWNSLSAQNDYWVDALQYNPSGYRLWTQFLIMLDQHPISYVALVAIVFIPVSWFLYLNSPKDSRFMMFAWLAFTISQASIRQGPSFALLALAILLTSKKGSWLMVIPMTMVKEHAGLVYIIYLVAVKKYKTAVVVSILWVLTFFIIRVIVGEVAWRPNPLTGEIVTTPILTLAPYIIRLAKWKVQLYIIAEVLLCVMFLKDRTEVLMILLNLPIIVFFGLFYEPQLWLMMIVAIIYRRRIKQDEFDTVNNGGVQVFA